MGMDLERMETGMDHAFIGRGGGISDLSLFTAQALPQRNMISCFRLSRRQSTDAPTNDVWLFISGTSQYSSLTRRGFPRSQAEGT